MSRSFRTRLAVRYTGAMALGLTALSVFAYLVIRETLDGQIDASLLSVASIQASSVTDAPGGEMHFHEWELTPEEAAQVRDLNRFAQVWSEDGESLLRTRYITSDLPLDTAAVREAAAGSIVWVEAPFDGIPVRSLFYPLGRLGPLHGQHVLQVAAPLETRNRLLRRTAWFLLAISLVIIAGTLAGSWWLAERAVRPVHEITDQAEEIGAQTLGRRISAWADSIEYQRLVHVLNTMLTRLDAAFDAQRRFTADASHELRSPLTALRGELELARRRQRSREEYERVIDSSLEEVDRLSRIAEDLLTLARSDAGVLEAHIVDTHLADCVRVVAERLRVEADRKPVTLEIDAAGDSHAPADRDLVIRLVWNLVDNAIRFTPAGGRVRVTVSGTDAAVTVAVIDTGPGIPVSDRDQLFRRFFQLDEARTGAVEGAGLGLAIVRAIADVHGAQVEVSQGDEGGAAFTVRFPRHAAATGPLRVAPARPDPRS